MNNPQLPRRAPSGIDVETTLAHFAIVTYLIEPARLEPLIHPRFELDLIECDGRQFALLSIVPFLDEDFRFARIGWPKWRFGQTNYRIYVTDTQTREQVVWFLGTSLDSLSVYVPRYVWKLPWHRARIAFDCRYDATLHRYAHYRMTTTRSWADAEIELEDSGEAPTELQGFDGLETGLDLLTHPLTGYYYRRDGRLGSYAIWHDRLHPTIASVRQARFDLLDQLDLVESRDTSRVHSVLLQHRTEFTIYLPPKVADRSVGQSVIEK